MADNLSLKQAFADLQACERIAMWKTQPTEIIRLHMDESAQEIADLRAEVRKLEISSVNDEYDRRDSEQFEAEIANLKAENEKLLKEMDVEHMCIADLRAENEKLKLKNVEQEGELDGLRIISERVHQR